MQAEIVILMNLMYCVSLRCDVIMFFIVNLQGLNAFVT